MTTRLYSERDDDDFPISKAPRAGLKWTPATWRKLEVSAPRGHTFGNVTSKN